MKQKEFLGYNLNDYIYFQLTDYGKQIYKNHYESFDFNVRKFLGELKEDPIIETKELKYYADGDCNYMQLHQFMNIFGSHIYNKAVVKENKIYLNKEKTNVAKIG